MAKRRANEIAGATAGRARRGAGAMIGKGLVVQKARRKGLMARLTGAAEAVAETGAVIAGGADRTKEAKRLRRQHLCPKCR